MSGSVTERNAAGCFAHRIVRLYYSTRGQIPELRPPPTCTIDRPPSREMTQIDLAIDAP